MLSGRLSLIGNWLEFSCIFRRVLEVRFVDSPLL